MRLIESFFWGVIAAFGALLIELVFSFGISFYAGPDSPVSFSQLFFVPGFIIIAAIIEEIFKCLVIFKRIESLPLKKSYLANSLLIGLGFFAAELVLISTASTLPALQFLAEIAVIHMGIAGVIGYMAAIAKKQGKLATFLSAAAIATIFHASYNLLNLKRDPLENYIIFLILGLLIFANAAIFFRQARQSA